MKMKKLFLLLTLCSIICGCQKEYHASGFAGYQHMRASIMIKGSSVMMYGSATNTSGISWKGSATSEKNGNVYSFPQGFYINETMSNTSYGALSSYSYSDSECYAEITEMVVNGKELVVRGIQKGYMPIYDKPFETTFYK